ncbi:ATP-binding protein [Actinomadura kijaniata]|uniref:ATP-binding protein n=1 Tax=Actinomadura kijaniata TaxID=46161 RepID=UPI003F1B2737
MRISADSSTGTDPAGDPAGDGDTWDEDWNGRAWDDGVRDGHVRDDDGRRPDPGGGRPGRVWALPSGPACASHARRVLGEALTGLGVPRDTVSDAQLMVSELATNAYQHAGDHGPHELWLYLGDPPDVPDLPWTPLGARPTAEIRCAVFDGHADARLPGYSWTSGDCGRGLSIVRELAEGRWGVLRTLSRLGPPVRGKAVWFAIRVTGRISFGDEEPRSV